MCIRDRSGDNEIASGLMHTTLSSVEHLQRQNAHYNQLITQLREEQRNLHDQLQDEVNARYQAQGRQAVAEADLAQARTQADRARLRHLQVLGDVENERDQYEAMATTNATKILLTAFFH